VNVDPDSWNYELVNLMEHCRTCKNNVDPSRPCKNNMDPDS
jgi:hypothetical protein